MVLLPLSLCSVLVYHQPLFHLHLLRAPRTSFVGINNFICTSVSGQLSSVSPAQGSSGESFPDPEQREENTKCYLAPVQHVFQGCGIGVMGQVDIDSALQETIGEVYSLPPKILIRNQSGPVQ